jgi:predicted dehydrogenase
MATQPTHVHPAGSDKVRIGLIGCGNRGTGALLNCFEADEGVELVAMADMFRDQVDKSLKTLKEKVSRDKIKVKDSLFLGFDAYKQVLQSDVHSVILATPPHFRPMHLKAAIRAGKHVFAEKPFAVDPVGVRSILETAELADQKALSIIVGTQQRYQSHYQEIINRIHEGQIGEIVGGSCYWNWGKQDWHLNPRQPGWTDMEWQLRNWPYFTWLSGDHIVEQHFHNVDIINWAMGSPPVKAMGLGGRQARVQPKYGNIWDHFTVEFEYPNGVLVTSMCSQINGTVNKVGEHVTGATGYSFTNRAMGYIKGQNPYEYED